MDSTMAWRNKEPLKDLLAKTSSSWLSPRETKAQFPLKPLQNRERRLLKPVKIVLDSDQVGEDLQISKVRIGKRDANAVAMHTVQRIRSIGQANRI